MAERQLDLYDVLGVASHADATTIKRAFRARARALHPDVCPDPEAADRFAELSRAYAVLSRPAARLLYDRVGYLGPGNGGFEERPATGREERLFDLAEVEIEPIEAARGTIRRVRVAAIGPCRACDGAGTASGAAVLRCEACGGDGSMRRSIDARAARVLEVERCRICAGEGRVVADACPRCNGTGRTRTDRTLTLRIPPGATSGELVTARSDANGAGDVFVVLRVRPDRDSRLVRYAATAALVLAVGLFLVIALAPNAIARGP
jgi:molecular chaperone DnaJ